MTEISHKKRVAVVGLAFAAALALAPRAAAVGTVNTNVVQLSSSSGSKPVSLVNVDETGSVAVHASGR
jgi:hypothetical protein